MEVLPGANFATCVSFQPFVVTSWAMRDHEAEDADDPAAALLAAFVDANNTDAAQDTVPGAPCEPVVARCYRQPSAELSSLGFETMFAIKCLAKKLEILRTEEPEEVYVAVVWCLRSETHYSLSYTSGSVDHTVGLTTTRLMSFFTHKEFDAQFVQDVGVLKRCDVVDMLKAQAETDTLLMWPPDPTSLDSMTEGLRFLLYDALFALPEPIPTPTNVMWLLQVPNGAKRYVLDLASMVPIDETSPTPAATTFSWRRHSKVRKLIREGQDGKYVVRVHDTKEGIVPCLARAQRYHTDLHGSTWLSEEFNALLATTAEMCRYENSGYVPYGTPGLRLLCIELVEQPSGKVLAGCCGFACGAAYHDFTMFTLERGQARFGTFLTKLIGEALQKCGYDLWYWGNRLGYMADYDRRYGGLDMDRTAFYNRWCAARERQPTSGPLWEFLRAGRAMVPGETSAN